MLLHPLVLPSAVVVAATRPAGGNVRAAARRRLLGSSWPIVLIGAAAVTGLLALAGVRL